MFRNSSVSTLFIVARIFSKLGAETLAMLSDLLRSKVRFLEDQF